MFLPLSLLHTLLLHSVLRYDAFSSILGEGKPFVGIANSYLQSGHTVLLALVLLCGFIELPGFPLTSLPYDVREFLKVCCVLWRNPTEVGGTVAARFPPNAPGIFYFAEHRAQRY